MGVHTFRLNSINPTTIHSCSPRRNTQCTRKPILQRLFTSKSQEKTVNAAIDKNDNTVKVSDLEADHLHNTETKITSLRGATQLDKTRTISKDTSYEVYNHLTITLKAY